MVEGGPQRFRVIEGGEQPKPYRKRTRKEAEPLICHKCNGAASVEIRLGRMIREGRAEGGTKAIVCAQCLAKGDLTILA